MQREKIKCRRKYKLSDQRSIIILGVVCWITYFSIYLGRLNLSASMSEMVCDGILGKAQLGSIAAVFYLSYGLGQLPSGILGDYIQSKLLVLIGVIGTATMNYIFPFMDSVIGMQIVWFVNGFAQAMIWPPMFRMVTDMTAGNQSVNIILMLSFTSPIGMLCTYLLSSMMIRTVGWEYCFWSAGVWLIGIAVLWFLSVSGLERQSELVEIQNNEKSNKDNKNSENAVWKSVVASGILWIILATFIHGVLKDGLTTWIPTYLTERFAIEPSFAVLLTMVLPIVNLSGVYIADYVNKIVLKNEVLTAALAFVITLLSIISMILFIGKYLYGTVVLFAIVTSMMTSVNTLFISLVPIHFQKEGKVASISGILNAATYLGSAVASLLFGYVAEKTGWSGTQGIWCLCAIAGTLCCMFSVSKWKLNRKNIYEE